MTQPQQVKDILTQAAERLRAQRETMGATSKEIAQERRKAIQDLEHPEDAPQ